MYWETFYMQVITDVLGSRMNIEYILVLFSFPIPGTQHLTFHTLKEVRFDTAHSIRGYSPCKLAPRQKDHGRKAWRNKDTQLVVIAQEILHRAGDQEIYILPNQNTSNL